MELSREHIYRKPRQRLAWVQHLLKAKFKRPHRRTVQCWQPYLARQGVALDIGAHFGYIAKELAVLREHELDIIAFEPIAYCADILERVMRSHPSVRIERLALSDKNGMADIAVPVKANGRLAIGLSHFGREEMRDYIIERVKTQTLDDYMRDNDIGRVVFMKADIEGAELPVLHGAMGMVRRDRPVIIFEINDDFCRRAHYRASDIFALLKELDYQAFIYQSDNSFAPVQGYQYVTDYLFVPREKIET